MKSVGLPARWRHAAVQGWRTGLLGNALLLLLAAIYAHGPIRQDPGYHLFADARLLCGVQNAWNVLSNLPFLMIGIAGLWLCAGHRRPDQAAPWIVFFAGIGLTGLGSSYYHWAPSDATLLWDRLPMTLAFMGLLTALVAEHVGGRRFARTALLPALLVGLASVLWWRYAGDLRLYLWVQLAPLIGVPLVTVLFRPRYSHRRYLLYGLVLYVLAKLAEAWDWQIFSLSGHWVSGHTLKHLLAAAPALALLAMLWCRVPCGGSAPSGKGETP